MKQKYYYVTRDTDLLAKISQVQRGNKYFAESEVIYTLFCWDQFFFST